MLRFTSITLFLFFCGIAFGQKAVSKEIQNIVASGIHFQKTSLLKFETSDVHNRDLNLEGLTAGTVLNLDKGAIQQLIQEHHDFISISVPLNSRTNMVLTLKRHDIFTPDFKLFTSSDPANAIDYTPGLHYMGVVEGAPNSIVALSVFRDQVMAMIATDEGNLVIGRIKGDVDNRHILYNDRDIDVDLPFQCGTEDEGLEYTEEQLSAVQNSRDVNDCVRIYIEINDDIVAHKGGAVPATDYITGIFNQSFVLFANESLTLTISEILAWTTASPYTGTNSSTMLASYKANTEFFNGDFSHLISFDSIFGGVAAGFGGVCNGIPDLSKCFSGIRYNYQSVPVFSFPVFVVTHEMGHLLGSHHTHACVWNGNNTAIDGCFETEGSCPQPPLPPNGGTIMSYCQTINSGSYVNFNLGFGPQPGNVIRNSVNAAGNCLSACGQPTAYCTSNGVNSSTEYIEKIVLGTINNQSGNNGGYGNYTSLSTNLVVGTTYSITLTPKFTGGNKIKSWRVWIDYNQDFDWYDAGEMVGQGAGNNTISVTFTVPSYNPTVTTRMRVSMQYTGYPVFCGTFPIGEVEDYTVNISGAPTPTCSDGIQNQGETGVDCGGPCSPCPTCSDGIQNQNETGIDCGGVCAACPVGDSTVLLASYFETGMDSWIDGGSDVARVSGSNAWEGQYSIELADNSGAQSAMTSPVFDLSTAVGLQINFHFKAISMESGEDFWVQYKNGSGAWATIGSFVAGTNFNNNAYYAATVTVPNFVPTSAGSLRIQCDASDNNDQVYIDAVTIVRLNGTELIESGVVVQQVEKADVVPVQDTGADKALVVYPNPSSDLLNIAFDRDMQSIIVISLDGKKVIATEPNQRITTIDISSLANGIYFLFVQSDGEWYPAKFSKM